MAMTLRLPHDDNEALRLQAAAKGRSMQLVVQSAAREYIGRRRHEARVRDASASGARKYAEALRRLGEA